MSGGVLHMLLERVLLGKDFPLKVTPKLLFNWAGQCLGCSTPQWSSQVLQLVRCFKNWFMNTLCFHPLSSKLMKHKVIKRECGGCILIFSEYSSFIINSWMRDHYSMASKNVGIICFRQASLVLLQFFIKMKTYQVLFLSYMIASRAIEIS